MAVFLSTSSGIGVARATLELRDPQDQGAVTSGATALCRFEIRAAELGPGQTDDWWIQDLDAGRGDPSKAVLWGTYAADDRGAWTAGPFELDDGQYRLVVEVGDVASGDRSDVAQRQRTFTVRCPAPRPAVRVHGNRLRDSSGEPLILRGVNRMGFEYSCVQGKGLVDGRVDQSSVDAIKRWRVNVVRLPLNEHCWLGLGGTPSGEAYRRGVEDYVALLIENGLYVILDLHWSAPRTRPATGQDPMPNTDHSALFWSSVAERFKDEGRVIFDLFNEPVPNNNQRDDTDEAASRSWQCWRDGAAGGTCDAVQMRGMVGSEVAGMQSLVDAVRAAGATNVIILGGIQFANTLWSNPRHNWLTYKPVDPLNRLVAAFHAYNTTWCRSISCLEAEVAPVAAHVPVVAGEIGNDDCDATWLTAVLKWLDRKQDGYLAWTWSIGAANDCASKKLIVDEAGRPSVYGQIYRTHLASLDLPP